MEAPIYDRARLGAGARAFGRFVAVDCGAIVNGWHGDAAFTMGVARASLAALRANVPAAGAVDYCLDAGGLMLARPWTTPVYPFTADMIVGDPKAANIASGSAKPNQDKVGKVTKKQLAEIWKIKKADMNAKDEAAGIKIIAGTARNMGIDVID